MRLTTCDSRFTIHLDMPSLSQSYRPHRFVEVTGQQHVTETLRRAVASGLLAHAYVFSGPRGIGKTTSARIFAQALNCYAPKEGEPCGECVACRAFADGRLMDVIELDAATHTGVETIREAIVEHVRFAPVFGKAKVYILDEAHMLSTSSWNALLKTLEEPPPYAYFVLATTEWHKIPATIISRCQRFEFKRVSDEVLAARVRDLAEREGWKIDESVTRLIVSRADGCIRDAETLLGQLGSLGRECIDESLAGLVIPPTHLPLAAGLMVYWAKRDHGGALQESRRLVDEGIAVLPLFDDLLQIVRELIRAMALPETTHVWKEGSSEQRAMVPLLNQFSPAELHDLALALMERRKDIKSGVDPLFALELVSTMVACKMLVPKEMRGSQEVGREEGCGQEEREGEERREVVMSREALQDPSVSSPLSTAPAPQSPVSSVIDLPTIRVKWNAIVRAIDEKNHSLPFILKISQPHDVQGDCLIIRFQYPFHRDKVITDVKNRRVVEGCIREVLGIATLTVDGVVEEDATRAESRSNDMVTNILKAFGGQVVEG